MGIGDVVDDIGFYDFIFIIDECFGFVRLFFKRVEYV